MEYELKHGKALVIAGPQGCGKSTLAREIAEKHGSFVETDADQLESPRGLNDLMVGEPITVICEGIPKSDDAKERLKKLISGGEVKVNIKHCAPKMVKAPNFIFCTGEIDPFPLIAADRRFHVIELGAM